MARIINSLRHPYSRILGGESLTFYLEGEMIVAVDQGGFVPLREDFEELIKYWKRFYDEYTDDEIIELVEESKRQRAQRATYSEEKEIVPPNRSGYIYILRGGGYYKIGKTTRLNQRITEISPKLPFEVELIHTIETENIDSLEEFLHEQFADKRANGEWFRLDENDIKALKQMPQG